MKQQIAFILCLMEEMYVRARMSAAQSDHFISSTLTIFKLPPSDKKAKKKFNSTRSIWGMTSSNHICKRPSKNYTGKQRNL